MNLLDKVIQEWSFRTRKGYPDINSKEDMDLFESIFGFRIDEGAKVEFDKGKNPQKISLDTKQIEGEQLVFDPKATKKLGFTVYSSLVSNSTATDIKASMDALKGSSELISSAELERIVKWTIPVDKVKYTHIAILESSKGLNNTLAKVFKKIYPSAKVSLIGKVSFENRQAAVDKEEYDKAAPSIKQAIDKWVEAGKDEKGPIKITKTGNIQSQVIQRLKSKYDIGQSTDINRHKKSETILDVIIDAIQGEANLLIVDDNLHTGTDFRKLFHNVMDVKERLQRAFVEDVKDIEKIIDISPQERTKQETELINLYYKTLERVNRLIKNPRKYIQGYVLYLLSNKDIKN